MKFVIRRLNKSCYERQDATHPARSPLHCFFYLSEGSVLVDIGGATYFMQEDDLIIIPAGQIFKVRYYENSKGYMGGFHAASFGISPTVAVWSNPKIILDKTASGHISALLERLCLENGQSEPDEGIISGYLAAFIAEAEAVCRRSNGQLVRHNDAVCSRFFELLFHNGGEGSPVAQSAKFSVTYYADRLQISPNHLNKVVKGVTGKSPSVWIEEAVIQEAKRLLRTTALPLGEIASLVGILDQSYFARRFKKHEGVSPREYRNRLSGYNK